MAGSEINKETIQELVKLGRNAVAVQTAREGGIPFAVIPGDCKIESLDKLIFNDHNKAPERIRGNVVVADPASFQRYYLLFSDANSQIFADEQAATVVGILDYHGALSGDVGPRWCQHRVTLAMRPSEQWKTWLGFNNKQFTQQQFAEFLEQNAIGIKEPAPASIREMANDLGATTEVEFGSSQRLNDGQVRFKYTETTKTTVGGSAIQVPDHFKLEVPIFVGAASTAIHAFLRYRIKEQKLVFWYTLLRPEEAARQAFITARTQIADALKEEIINGVA